MPVGMLTREYPPFVYGGGGVHVEFLVRHLRRSGVAVDVHCLGEPRPGAAAYALGDLGGNPALDVLAGDLAIAGGLGGASLVHSHTWYTNMAGHWAARLHDVPHVLTAHSLEPLRPWKAEQLGGGYRLSSWAERTAIESADAVIAVSAAMRADVLAQYPVLDPARVVVIRNGVDPDLYFPDPDPAVLRRLGVDPARPYVAFVGRVTRQKGLPHLLRAARLVDPDVQFVLLAGAADTPEAAAEVRQLAAERAGVVLVPEMLPPDDVRQVLSSAAVFCCPSVYEPLGIVNLEAMACGTPVVAGAMGGIPEVVADGVTGTLVPYDAADEQSFERDLAAAITHLVADSATATAMGAAGRRRVLDEFGWDAVAARTAALYTEVQG
ncbi:glycogen synthase [Cryptosporangium aurantiacum]|uniref:Starch synthase n=1 Tax=Cryptosporangium aurantiacum TaxID=134849 RepID=A0A1M7RJG2_9ACTN|nr:glycogen synthase [Cryptosporangium aurantiacum]SHN46404.1 starch synthase [Cryptosporangium aurantiacum]